MQYKLEQNVKVVVTRELADAILDILEARSYRKPLLLVSTFQLQHPSIQEMVHKMEETGRSYVLFDGIIPDPPAYTINDGAALFQEKGCDCLIAIGGGSAIDTARGINIVRKFGGKIEDYVSDRTVPEFCEGLIAVPTTSGTGSELSNALVVSDDETHAKLAVLSNNAVSEYAVLCPPLVTTLPAQMTAATGMDAFAHAAEAYTSALSSPITDAICEKVMYLIAKYLPKAVENGYDLEARERMMIASCLAGWMLNNAGTHLGHSQAHIVGAKYKIPHGAVCAYALPGTMLYTAEVNVKKVKEIGLILGAQYPDDPTDLEVGRITAQRIRWFRDEVLGMKPWSAYEVAKEELLACAPEVAAERFAGNAPMPVSEELCRRMLEEWY